MSDNDEKEGEHEKEIPYQVRETRIMLNWNKKYVKLYERITIGLNYKGPGRLTYKPTS